MDTLSNGSRGEAVEALQKKLLAMGFNPGPVDGAFGPKTEAAVTRFQEREGLGADGIAGTKTFTALGMLETAASDHSLSDLAAEVAAKRKEASGAPTTI